MAFSSISFLFYFLPLFLAAYFAAPRRARNGVLLAASLLFYAWGESFFILVLIVSIAANHVFGRLMSSPGGSRTNMWLVLGLAFNLANLGWFKYAGFISGELARVLGGVGIDASALVVGPHLPLGISFFTFQAISYLIDVRRGDVKSSTSVFDTAVYIAMFPQLVAGPIIRYKTIADQIRKRSETIEKIYRGIRTFAYGLAQKVLIADVIAAPVDQIFATAPEQLTPLIAWFGTGAYALQIYFDFAGYSNMAIGIGLMLGFQFPKNFDFPYMAKSVTEFWRRWHMTLSQWFRDYLYIPLGGGRASQMRVAFNLWTVFLLCGLWHGAAFTFVFWGAFHGALLTFERAGLKRLLEKTPRVVQHGYLLLAVSLGWVLFRAESLDYAGAYYAALAGLPMLSGTAQAALDEFVSQGVLWVAALGLLVSFWPAISAMIGKFRISNRIPAGLTIRPGYFAVAALEIAAIGGLLLMSVVFIAGGAYSPFIYFRF